MVEGEEERARRGGREVEREEGKKNGIALQSGAVIKVAWLLTAGWVTVT
jgi:hypothetical protein